MQIEYDLVIDGQATWFQTTISPLDADSTLWVAHDITERKYVEEAQRIAEANYRSIFQNATVGIYQSTPQGRFLSINPVMARIFGYDSPEQMLSNVVSIENQLYGDPADRREFQRLMMAQGEVDKFINRYRRKDGSHIWIQENARAIKDVNGSILHYEGFVTDITERKQVEEELRLAKEGLENTNLELQQSLAREQLLASTDGLTGLCNHRHLFELAAREFLSAVRYRRPLTFLMFDMDEFKKINDTLGHSAGDKLLVDVAQTAVAQVRGPDVVARYGGDEFVIMMPEMEEQHLDAPAVRKIRAQLNAPYVIDKQVITLTASVGTALYCGDEQSCEELLQQAKNDMNSVKVNSKPPSISLM